MKKSYRGLKVTFLLLGVLPVVAALATAIILGFAAPDMVLPTGIDIFSMLFQGVIPYFFQFFAVLFSDFSYLAVPICIAMFAVAVVPVVMLIVYIVFAIVKKRVHFIFSALGFLAVCFVADILVAWFSFTCDYPDAVPASGDNLFIMIFMIAGLVSAGLYLVFSILDIVLTPKKVLDVESEVEGELEEPEEEEVELEPEPALVKAEPKAEKVAKEEKKPAKKEAKKVEPKKEENKPEPKKEVEKKPEPKKEAAKPAKQETKKPEPKKEEKKPAAKKETKPAPKKEEKKPEPKAAPKKETKPAPKPEPKNEVAKPAPKKEEKTSNGKTYHISRRPDLGGKWQVKAGGAEKALKIFDTQKEAIEYAKQFGSYRIHSMSGKIRKG